MKQSQTPFITLDKFEKISQTVENIQMPFLFYSIEDIKNHIEPNLKESLPFAIRLSQQPANTKQEKEARAYLLKILNNIIIM